MILLYKSHNAPVPHPAMYHFQTEICTRVHTRWRHQMETFSALLDIYAGNSPVTGEFPAQSPVMRSFDVFFDLCLNKRLSKQSWAWWFGTPSRPLCRHYNEKINNGIIVYIRFTFWNWDYYVANFINHVSFTSERPLWYAVDDLHDCDFFSISWAQ